MPARPHASNARPMPSRRAVDARAMAAEPNDPERPTRPPRRSAAVATQADDGAGGSTGGRQLADHAFGPPPHLVAPTFAAALCERHRGWAVDGTTVDRLPVGWRTLVEALFEDVSGVVGEGHRLVLRGLEEETGQLVVTLTPAGRGRASRLRPVVDAMVERARQASRWTCQACGASALLRACPDYTTLCDTHFEAHVVELERVLGRRRWHESALDATRDAEARAGAARDVPVSPERRPEAIRVALYELSDVRDAIGASRATDDVDFDGDPGPRPAAEPQTGQVAYLRAILGRGEAGRWRDLARPDPAQVEALDALDERAPHMAELTDMVRRNLRAAMAMSMPISLPAVMLVGEPGFGKSWYVGHLAEALGLPVRHHPMNAATLGEGLLGAHPVWREARPGLVGRTLLLERIANPLILVDEFDKPVAHNGEDPYRPFYTVLEPEGARHLVDEYLGFGMDASHVLWILAGNSLDPVPRPIADRLTVVTVPPMDEGHLAAVAASVYAEANAARRDYFDPMPEPDVLARLATTTPRGMRRALGEAMVRAAADGRRELRPDDVVVETGHARRRAGFGAWS